MTADKGCHPMHPSQVEIGDIMAYRHVYEADLTLSRKTTVDCQVFPDFRIGRMDESYSMILRNRL